MRKCKWCGREITVFCGMDDFCSTKCHDECWAEECKRSREKSQQREAEERRQREQREQHNAEERFERQQCEDDERHQREQRDAEERLKRQQREHEENLARQLREAEERAIAREKERERRADPQRWYGSEWVEHLKIHPEDASKCVWSSLEGEDIVALLEMYPELSIHCDLTVLSPDEWGAVLCKNPELAGQCNCWNSIPGKLWPKLLRTKNPVIVENCCWSSIAGDSWPSLLMYHPEYAKHCNWSAIPCSSACGGWETLLCRRPEYAEFCPKEKWQSFSGAELVHMLKCRGRLGKYILRILRSDTWVDVLSELPDYAEYCDWKFSDKDWNTLLSAQPQFFSHCEDWSILGSELLISLLRSQPECVTDQKLGGLEKNVWFSLLMDNPAYAQKCKVWDQFSADKIIRLVSEHLELTSFCMSAINKMSAEDLNRLLNVCPQCALSDGFNNFDSLSEASVAIVLGKKTEHELLELPIEKLMPIIARKPKAVKNVTWQQLAEKLRGFDWKSLSEDDRIELAMDYPACSEMALAAGFDPYVLSPRVLYRSMVKWPEKFESFDADAYDWAKFDKDPAEWARLVFFYPQYKTYCNPANVDWSLMDQWDDKRFWAWAMTIWPDETIPKFHKWKMIQEDWWPQLVERQPKLAPYRDKYCPEKKSASVAPQTSQPKEEPLPSKEKDSERETPSERSEAQKARPEPAQSGRKQGIIKKYWMPTLAALLILSAFDEGGVASFIIGAGLGAFWWWKKRKA